MAADFGSYFQRYAKVVYEKTIASKVSLLKDEIYFIPVGRLSFI